jgi:hypothetical protein
MLTVAILRSVQRCRLYVNFLIAARKHRRYKSKKRKHARGAHPQVSLSLWAKFQLFRFLDFLVTASRSLLFSLSQRQCTMNSGDQPCVDLVSDVSESVSAAIPDDGERNSL